MARGRTSGDSLRGALVARTPPTVLASASMRSRYSDCISTRALKAFLISVTSRYKSATPRDGSSPESSTCFERVP
jgi:hypothetical protein